MANEKRLIDANAVLKKMQNWNTRERLINCVEYAHTVDAIPVEDLERILSTTPGLELWDYQKRGIMSAVNRLCGKEKNDG